MAIAARRGGASRGRDPRRGRARRDRQAPPDRARPDGPPRRRSRPDRGLSGACQDADRAVGRTRLLDEVLAHPVHARPDALGRHGLGDLRPARCRLPLPAGSRVREPPPCRRDQSRPAEDAGSAPRGHAGAAGDGRRAHPSAGAAVHRARDPEPDRVRGHVSLARGPARPIPDARLGRVSGQGRRAPASARARRAAGGRGRAAGRLRPGDAARAPAGGRGGARLRADRLVHGRHRGGHARRSADSGRRLAARVAGAAQARALARRRSRAGTSSPPRT